MSAGLNAEATILEALALVLEPGTVTELRAIGRDGHITSGYFDGPALLAERAGAILLHMARPGRVSRPTPGENSNVSPREVP